MTTATALALRGQDRESYPAWMTVPSSEPLVRMPEPPTDPHEKECLEAWEDILGMHFGVLLPDGTRWNPPRPTYIDLAAKFWRERDLWVPLPNRRTIVYDLMQEIAGRWRMAEVNESRPLTLETIREARRAIGVDAGRYFNVEWSDGRFFPPSNLPPRREPEDPRVERFNRRLRTNGIPVQISSGCMCELCSGARNRLRVDGANAPTAASERMAAAAGGGALEATTSLEQRQANTVERTVDDVLGDIDELLAEFNAN